MTVAEAFEIVSMMEVRPLLYRDLAKRLDISKREAGLALMTLESEGLVVSIYNGWDEPYHITEAGKRFLEEERPVTWNGRVLKAPRFR